MTADLSKIYLGPNEQNQRIQNSVVRQMLENQQLGQYEIVVPPSGDTSGATDYTAITNAITAVSTRGLSTVRLQQGNYYVNNTIVIANDGITLAGSNSGGSGQTQILAEGSFPCIKISRAGAQVRAWGLRDFVAFVFSGQAAAIQIDSSLNGHLDNVAVTNASSGCVSLLLRTDQAATINNCIFNNFSTFLSTGATSSIGLRLDSSLPGQDPFANFFNGYEIQLNNSNQTGLYLGGCDTNYFLGGIVSGGRSIAPTAIMFDYTNPATASWPGGNQFFGIDCGFNITSGATGYTNTGVPNQDTFPNVIHGFSFGNGNVPNYPLIGTEFVVPYRPWDATQPTASALSGALTTANTNLLTKVMGRTVFFRCEIDVSNIGSGATGFSVPLPYSPPNGPHACSAVDLSNIGGNLCAAIVSTANTLKIFTASGNTTNHNYSACGHYEMSSTSTST